VNTPRLIPGSLRGLACELANAVLDTRATANGTARSRPDLGATLDPFKVSVVDERRNVVRVEGELDIAGVPWLTSVLARLDGDIELECSALDFIDAAGVGAFVRAHHACAARGDKLVLVEPSRSVLRVLSLVGLDASLTIRRHHEC
jgi:anti-anti-sigma factor